MRIIETESRLVLRDIPGALWTLGLAFVASGLFVLSMPIWMRDWRSTGIWAQLAVLVIGLGHLAGGLLTAGQARATVTELDRVQGRGSHRIRRLWSRWQGAGGRDRTDFALADARAVEIVRSEDSDGDPMYRLRLWLAGSESLWLQAQATHGEARALEQAARVREYLGLPVAT